MGMQQLQGGNGRNEVCKADDVKKGASTDTSIIEINIERYKDSHECGYDRLESGLF